MTEVSRFFFVGMGCAFILLGVHIASVAGGLVITLGIIVLLISDL